MIKVIKVIGIILLAIIVLAVVFAGIFWHRNIHGQMGMWVTPLSCLS